MHVIGSVARFVDNLRGRRLRSQVWSLGLYLVDVGRRRLRRMRASLLVVVIFALLSGCSPDEPNDIAVVSEPPAPKQADVVQPLAGGPPPVQGQLEEDCRRLVELEPSLQKMP